MEPLNVPATELVRALSAKQIGSRELLEHYLERIDRINPEINAIVTLDAERALEAAADADNGLGPAGPLAGLPVTVKDCLETAGVRTTCGIPFLSDHVPTSDATAVARLKSAGAIVFGKTNAPPYVLHATTRNDLFGATRNPFDPSRTPGGSSGGSTAAVAAGLTALDVGSDSGGSIRMPAHFCGVFGHKPSFGIVPQRGHIPPMPGGLADADLNVIGPIARSAADLILALDVIAGPGRAEAVGWRLELPPPRPAPLRLAVWFDDPAWPIDDEVRNLLMGAVEALRTAGASVIFTIKDLPATLDRHRELTQQLYAASISHAWSPETIAEMATGGPTDGWRTGLTIGKREWNLVDEERLALREGWASFFTRCDAVLTPVVCCTAPRWVEPGDRTLVVNGEEMPGIGINIWMEPANVAYLPATVVPVGLTADGLPVGLQIMGPHLEDRTTLALAVRLERLLGGFHPPTLN